MKNILITGIAGLAILFASSSVPTAEARPWRAYRNYNRNYNQFQRQYQRSYRNPGYYRWNRGYYVPRRYYVPSYRYRSYGYPGYWYGRPRAGFYFRF